MRVRNGNRQAVAFENGSMSGSENEGPVGPHPPRAESAHVSYQHPERWQEPAASGRIREGGRDRPRARDGRRVQQNGHSQPMPGFVSPQTVWGGDASQISAPHSQSISGASPQSTGFGSHT